MSPRTLLVLVVLLVVTAGGWVLTRGSAGEPSKGAALQGQALAPGVEKMDGITRLTITRGEKTATAVLENGIWRSHDAAGGFPLDASKITALMRSVAGFKTDQPRTATSSRHNLVHLDWPDPRARARRLTVHAGESLLADLILGKQESGRDDSMYVRLADSDQTYLSRGSATQQATNVELWIPEAACRITEDEIAWIAYDGVKLEPDETMLAEAAEAETESAPSNDADSTGNYDPSPSPEPAWSATVTDPERASRWSDSEIVEARTTLPTWLSTLTVEAVKPWVASPAENLDDVHITYGLKSGGRIEVTSHRDDDDVRWLQLLAVDTQTVEATTDASVTASALARTGAHWIRVSSFHFWGLDKLVEEAGVIEGAEEGEDPDQDDSDDLSLQK